jgi:flagellar biosynthesis GTPase FlhF
MNLYYPKINFFKEKQEVGKSQQKVNRRKEMEEEDEDVDKDKEKEEDEEDEEEVDNDDKEKIEEEGSDDVIVRDEEQQQPVEEHEEEAMNVEIKIIKQKLNSLPNSRAVTLKEKFDQSEWTDIGHAFIMDLSMNFRPTINSLKIQFICFNILIRIRYKKINCVKIQFY